MNFSKKNHEYKIINIKNVSKKIILGIVFVFATVNFVNANSNVEDYPGCAADAWRYGTEEGGGDPEEEYNMTLLFIVILERERYIFKYNKCK